MKFPLITQVRQTQMQPRVPDPVEALRKEWRNSVTASRLKPGMRVAVGVGSRGIANLAAIVRTTVDLIREAGAIPFIVAAMGSHGGAQPEGQRELLAGYGITESAMGVPIQTAMDVVQVGTNTQGEPVWWDANAARADGVIVVARVKPHTDFRGRFESGIVKMLVIGLGKQVGASQHHRWGVRGLLEVMPESAKTIVERCPVLGGVAIIENAHEETAKLIVVDRNDLFEVEPKLLEESRELMGRLPFHQIDFLVIGEIGKNYSGSGIDPNVVGRLFLETQPEFESPKITRICALDLSPESHGNAVGIGLADLTTERLLAAIDPNPTRMNILTACFMGRTKLPFGFQTDQECFSAGLSTCWQPNIEKVRMAIIPNSLEVNRIWVTQPLANDAKTHPHLNVGNEFRPIPFDREGNLEQEILFPESIRAKRTAACRGS